MALDEDQLRAATHVRRALEDRFDVAAFVARGHDHRHQRLGVFQPRLRSRAGDDEVGQRRHVQRPQARQIAIGQLFDAAQAHRQQHLVPVAGDLEVGQPQQVVDVVDRQPVLLEQRLAQAERAGDVERRLPQAAVEVQDEPRSRPRHAFELPEGDLHDPTGR